MFKRFAASLSVGALALTLITACQSPAASTPTSSALAAPTVGATVAAVVESSATSAVTSSPTAAVPSAETAPGESSPTPQGANSAADAAAAAPIVLAGNSITADDAGVTVNGSIATITAAGSYSLSGVLADGQIVVDTQDQAPVRLILNGVEIANATGAPIYVAAAEAVEIVLASDTTNTITDAATYLFPDPAEDEPNAAIFSKADLTISGDGALTVTGNYNDGIASKDGLVIAGGAITVNAVDDGIRGKDYLVIENGVIAVQAQGDGLKADNEEDAEKGYIVVQDGVVVVTSGGDGIAAETDVRISGGQFEIVSGGGSANYVEDASSAKGIKGGVSVAIEGGVLAVDSADDALHANDSITIDNGSFTLASGDDAIHADTAITINDGQIEIIRSTEGIESGLITINGGDIALTSSDDGINISFDDDAGTAAPGGQPGGPGGFGPGGATTYTGDHYLYIHGGNILVMADGDGIDSNGAIEMTGGVVIVHGPTMNGNSALDYDGVFNISGGFLAAAGSAGMAQAPSPTSSQPSLLLNFSSPLAAGTLIHLQTEGGDSLLTFAPRRAFQALAFSSPDLIQGDTIEVYAGGSATEPLASGLYQGTYTPGELAGSIPIVDMVTTVGSRPRR